MSKTMKLAFVMIFALLAQGIAKAQSPATKRIGEQTSFHEDDKSFDNAMRLPDNVLNALKATKEAREILGDKPDLNSDQLAELFSAVEVHLSVPNEADYIVKGNFPLVGADNSWFWIVRSTPILPKVILFANGNSITLMKRRTNGYRNIRSDWSSAAESITEVFRFNGSSYKFSLKTDRQVP